LRSLHAGRKLCQYKVLRVLGAGGFGITYLARDESLEKLFAIKEFFPEEYAVRAGASVKPKTSQVVDFGWARERFIEEARILARFDHPNIAKVVQIFELNNTAYMVQEYEHGRDLAEWFREINDAPTQTELDSLIEPLLTALELVHRNDLLHRDISPGNIYIRDNGTPVLLDFGSAKDAVAQRTKNISAIVKAGYSAPELYSSRGRSQGPWSDIYSLAATLYHAISGAAPEEATERLLADNLAPSKDVARGTYRQAFLDAVDSVLRITPKNRPQTVAEWRSMLFADDGHSPAHSPADTNTEPVIVRPPSNVPAVEQKILSGIENDLTHFVQEIAVPEKIETVAPPQATNRERRNAALYVSLICMFVFGAWLYTLSNRPARVLAATNLSIGRTPNAAPPLKPGPVREITLLKIKPRAEPSTTALATVVPAPPPQRAPEFASAPFWESDESLLSLVVDSSDQNRRTFAIRSPSAALRSEGVGVGALLFDGKRTGNTYSGKAFLYSRDCPTAPYPVTGTVAADERSVRLAGRVPVYGQSCRVLRYEDRDTLLVFHDKEDNWGRAR
jgi:serine/threonine protein kinase